MAALERTLPAVVDVSSSGSRIRSVTKSAYGRPLPRATIPDSASSITAAATNCLLTAATWNRVCGVHMDGAGLRVGKTGGQFQRNRSGPGNDRSTAQAINRAHAAIVALEYHQHLPPIASTAPRFGPGPCAGFRILWRIRATMTAMSFSTAAPCSQRVTSATGPRSRHRPAASPTTPARPLRPRGRRGLRPDPRSPHHLRRHHARPGTLHVRLDPPTGRRRAQALSRRREQLNTARTRYPATHLLLHYEVKLNPRAVRSFPLCQETRG